MLKSAFIGAGNRSQKAHYPNVQRLSDQVSMSAVCEMDEERLGQVAKKYEFPHTFTDHKKMLDAVELDLIYCVMNEKWLLQPALDCLNAGKHLFIEKPPGKSSDETRQLKEAAEANNVFCMVGYQRRYAAVTREALKRVGRKGPVSLVTTTFNKQMLGTKADGLTTTLWNDVTHIVDQTRFLAGGEPVEVTAYQDKFGSDSYNCYTALIRFDNGVTGAVFGNRASGGRVLRSEIHGTGIGCYMKLPEELEVYEDNKREVIGGWEIDGVPKEDEDRYEGALSMHEHFLECIRTNTLPSSDIRDVVNTVALVDQIEASDV